MMKKDAYVDIAVVMLCYNHEKWIEKAISSVLMQETSASYRIYIHDDASNDSSPKLIEAFKSKYPDKIECILQKENQYSKGGVARFIYPRLNCKYIAVCEGDDYWIGKDRLDIQFKYMESHPKCSYTFGEAIFVDLNGQAQKKFMWHQWTHDGIGKKLKRRKGTKFSPEELVLLEFTPTATVMYRSSLRKYIDAYPDPFDLVTRLVCASNGYGYFFNKVMAAYRTGNIASANGQASSSIENYRKQYLDRHVKALIEFDKRTFGRFRHIVIRSIDRKHIQMYQRFLEIDKMKMFFSYRDLNLEYKLRCQIKKHFGGVYKLVTKAGVYLMDARMRKL